MIQITKEMASFVHRNEIVEMFPKFVIVMQIVSQLLPVGNAFVVTDILEMERNAMKLLKLKKVFSSLVKVSH